MTRRPVQQARRITDKQLVSWPVREQYVYSPIRSTPVQLGRLFLEAIALTICFTAIVLTTIVRVFG